MTSSDLRSEGCNAIGSTPCCETQHTLFPLDFNRSIVIEDRPERLTGDAGVLALRQIDQRLGLSDWLATQLIDPRRADRITHPQVELLRTRLCLIAQGYRDGDDADRLGLDPAFRLAVSQRRGTAPLNDHDPRERSTNHVLNRVGAICEYAAGGAACRIVRPVGSGCWRSGNAAGSARRSSAVDGD